MQRSRTVRPFKEGKRNADSPPRRARARVARQTALEPIGEIHYLAVSGLSMTRLKLLFAVNTVTGEDGSGRVQPIEVMPVEAPLAAGKEAS